MNHKPRISEDPIVSSLILPKTVTPIVYSGVQNEKSIIYFNDYFEKKPIFELINNIESIRQIAGYNEIDLYFTSDGGFADSLFVLADYLNNIQNIRINFIVTGMAASCGFYILVLIDNPNVNIVFNDFCTGLIHFADSAISDRSQRSNEDERYEFSKFFKHELDRLNEWMKTEILPYLGLSKEDMKKLEEGKDVYLTRDELEEVVTNYKEYKYVTSEEFEIAYEMIDAEIEKLKESKRSMTKLKNKYKKVIGE